MDLKQLVELAKKKQDIDQEKEWSNGSSTYLEELQKELEEVQAEIISGNQPHLEDELGDVLWDYINILVNLEEEGKIDLDRVSQRALKKYSERVNGMLQGQQWDDIKVKQKKELDDELK